MLRPSIRKLSLKPSQLAILVGLFCSGLSTTSVADDTGAKSQQIETIIVTGEKLDRSLQQTTTSVTVFSGDDVDNGEDRSLYDLMDRAPNVLNAPSGIPHIRGVDGRGSSEGFLSYITGARPRVSTTIDGVAESWTGESFGKAGLWDTEQIEILKGPQSTTQGRNTIGGAIVIKTKDPTYDWESKVRAGYENEDSKYHLAALVSGPIKEDELAFRLAAEGTKGNGPIDYSLPGGDVYPWDPSDLNSHNIRGKLLWQPLAIPELSAKLTLVSRNEEGQYTNLVSKPYFNYENKDKRGTRRQDTKSQSYNADIKYEFSHELTADLLLSKRDYQTKFESYPLVEWTGDVDETNYTAESKLAYNPADANYSGIAGVYLYQRDQDSKTDAMKTDDKVKTMAMFIDTTTAISSSWNLLIGARLEKESQQRAFKGYGMDFVFDEGETVFLPKVGITYTPIESSTFGLTARKGYNAGGAGFNNHRKEIYLFEKESVWTYELSARSRFFDNKLAVNTNLFYNDYENYQTRANGGQGRYDTFMTNIPESQTYGLETDANLFVGRGLNVFANLGLLKTKITESPTGIVSDLEGNELNYAPEVTAGIGFQQSFDSGIFFGARLNHVAEYYSDLKNTEKFTSGGYTVANLNAGYEADSFTVRAYVKNATNEEYIYRFKHDLAEVGAPTTVGVTADYRF